MKSILRSPEILLIALASSLLLTNFMGNLSVIAVLIVTDLAIIKKIGVSVFTSKSLKLLTIYYFVVILYGISGYGILSTGKYLPLVFSSIIMYSVYLISCYLEKLEYGQVKFLLLVSIADFSICTGITYYIATINPVAIRLCFGEVDASEALEASVYRSMGIMSYSLAHSISVISIGFMSLFCYAKNMQMRIFSIFIWFILIKLQFDMTITTSLLISIFCGIIVLINKYFHGKTFITLSVLAIVIIVILHSGILIKILSYAESTNPQIYEKLNDAFSSYETGSSQGQMDYREELYSVSFYTFLSNPIFGLGVDNGSRTIIGEHSFLLDYLAYYGLFAFLYFGSWWVQYRKVVVNINKEYKTIFLYSFLPVCILVSTKASSVCVMMPFASLVFLQMVFLYLNIPANYSGRYKNLSIQL